LLRAEVAPRALVRSSGDPDEAGLTLGHATGGFFG
jgi:hypothetical protein